MFTVWVPWGSMYVSRKTRCMRCGCGPRARVTSVAHRIRSQDPGGCPHCCKARARGRGPGPTPAAR